MKRIAWLCLGAVLATLVLVGASVALSFRSHAAQYRALRIGWPILRTSALIQVLGQGVLAAFLSFWVTAIFFEIFSVKLIAIISILALLGVAALVKAIFGKVHRLCEADGQSIGEQDAPALWQRVRELAARLGTTPPDRIVAGIAPSFFVTEHPVKIGDATHEGRTLFVSLPMLKILHTEEADAVLGHELAHFSGEDTLWARKISPLMGKFELYLQNLGVGLSLVVGHFMHLFWKLYMLSLGRLSREREFRADAVGASVTSASAMQRALIKVAGYCEYRAKTEHEIIERNRVEPELRLADLMASGYGGFLKTFTGDEQAALSATPHPFDSHPPLNARLQHLGADATAALREEMLHQPVARTWHDSIPTAQALERGMWEAREKLIQDFHGQDLAWRLMPASAEDEAAVLALFPERRFRAKDGSEATLTYDRLHVSTWPAPIPFRQIDFAQREDAIFRDKRLTLGWRASEEARRTTVKFYPQRYVSEEGDLLAFFDRYYSRHKTAEARQASAGQGGGAAAG
jgi:Zn-dependent protease with chaperone function